MACERDRQGRCYYCDRLAAWIVARELPFDSIYYYGSERSLHLSHSP